MFFEISHFKNLKADKNWHTMDFVFSGLAATGGGGASGSSGSSSSSGVVGGDGSGFLVGWNQ